MQENLQEGNEVKNEILAYLRQLPRNTVFLLLALMYVAGTVALGAIPIYLFEKEWAEWWQWCFLVVFCDVMLLMSGMGEFFVDVAKLVAYPLVWLVRKTQRLRNSPSAD